jgi:hypothetical protein
MTELALSAPVVSPPRGRDKWLAASIAAFALVILCDPVLWELNYRIPGIIFILGLFMLRLAVLAVLFIWPVVCLTSIIFRWRRWRLRALAPLLISILMFLIGYFLNTTYGWLIYNEVRYAQGRDLFWRATKAGIYEPSGEYMGIQTIANWYPDRLSLGGAPTFYKQTQTGPMILFVTFMGIPDGMSGFLYAPRDIDPKKEWPELGLEWADVWDADRHVYFVGNR